MVQKAVDFVLSCSTETGLIASGARPTVRCTVTGSRLSSGEIYGMNPDDSKVRDAFARAVQLIINSQNEEGLALQPVPYDADVSVTICRSWASVRPECRHQGSQGDHRSSRSLRP